jgi:hypothetical protein
LAAMDFDLVLLQCLQSELPGWDGLAVVWDGSLV